MSPAAGLFCSGLIGISHDAPIVAIAELLQGEAEVSGAPHDADTIARLFVVRRTHR
jgi:hypothetical protein